MAMAKDFEYNLDDLTRLMEEQALNSPPAQGARPKKKSKNQQARKPVRESRRRQSPPR